MSTHYLIIVSTILLAAGKHLLHGSIARNFLKNTTDATLYNAIVFGGMSVIYFCFNGLRPIQTAIVIYGVIYGLLNASYQIIYTIAVRRGSVALTVLINTFSTIFTVAFGMLYYHETLRPANVVGVLFVFLSLLLAIDFKHTKNHNFSYSWFLLSLASMVLHGMADILIKIQKTNIPNQDISMLLVTYLIGSIALTLLYFIQSKLLKKPKTVALYPSRIMLMLSVSVILGAYFVVYLLGIGTVPSVIYFPLISIGPTTVVSVLSVFIFKDRLKRHEVISLCFGIAATLLLCI